MRLAARRISLAARRPHSQRLLRAGSAITLLAILVAAILLLPTGNRDAFLRLVTPPTPLPTATPQAGDDAFLWEHAVPWGRLFIDGKPGPNVQRVGGAPERVDCRTARPFTSHGDITPSNIVPPLPHTEVRPHRSCCARR